MSKQEEKTQITDTFLKSRYGAIVRCVSIVADAGRKDLAKQILSATKIDRSQFEKIKAQNT